ncbi:MAG: S-methyl-5-thioribose-1-phosphate isomerase [Chloroflexota bacterium]
MSQAIPAGSAPAAPASAVRWDGTAPVIIDQRRLPDALVHWRLGTVAEVVEAIRTLAVRGAPAIGVTGAYGMVVGLDEGGASGLDGAAAARLVADLAETIGEARPTAVNLRFAVDRVARAAAGAADGRAARSAALADAIAQHEEDAAACAAMGQHGRVALAGARRILTHCNTGRLATAGDGTALGVIYAKAAAGELDEVIACEARPLLQGGRLTAWELAQSGLPHRLIVDSAAGAAMAAGLVDAVIVGCDRVAANGDTANKIGTYNLAVLAARHGIPFWIAGPRSTLDAGTPDGAAIVIEERAAQEVRGFRDLTWTPPGVPVWNPAFDVTPHDLITGFVTDAGILRPPFGPAIAAALRGDAQGGPA